MNILTKICVVVLVVVNLFASAVFIAYANRSENWKQRFNDEKIAREASELTAANELAHASMFQTELANREKQWVAERGVFQEKITERDVQIVKLEAKDKDVQNSLQGINTKMAALTSRLDLMDVTHTEERKTSDKRVEAIAALQKDITDLNGKLVQAEAASRSQDGMVRALRSINADLSEQNKKLAAQMDAGGVSSNAGAASGQPVVPVVNIQGRVTAVDGDTVAINVGRGKGVYEGMVLVIHRKDKLVGYLRIDEVEVDEAVGVIEEKQADPKQGDTVVSKGNI